MAAEPNMGNFLLLVLAVCGAAVDGRYKAQGGERESKDYLKFFRQSAAVVFVILIGLGYVGGSALFGTLFASVCVWTFAGYELRRVWIRRKRSVAAFK
jgi:hypothetical protein